MTFEETVDKIRSLEIQGAQNIALAGVTAFGEKLKETSDEAELQGYFDELATARITEPALRNGMKFCMKNFKKNPNVVEEVVKYFKDSKAKIAEIGAEKIRDGMTVFTHCHASTVTAILIEAQMRGRKFTVRNTETRPRWQGRKTAEELASAGIPVIHSIDSAGRLALREADLFLFGADAITAEGNVINKIGTATFAYFSSLYQTPLYACSNSWKFDPLTLDGADEPIEERTPDEVWENPPEGVKISNPAFELTPADTISGVITELGVFKPEILVLEIQKNYPWMVE